ncbi:MAG: sulfite exporter TauE/SafE family protein [Gammaproteobacteria bacterium]|nr:sulfite exporter TauE/SafE family protein [Gammaproteobacteria bacterium]MBU1646433.1 sulfite exporter TauE/SafE family protein [Gammaproteobacteria bacterium]MBU1970976.1 sulfite exporter TauE/SafE family protein [Gammaproteobacteria bacterium]
MLDELAAGQVTLTTLWLLGVSMGLTACTVTCLPFMGTWALGRASGQKEAFLHTGVFLAGRITTYTLLAALAGAAGLGLAKALGGTWGNVIIGAASIGAGLWLLARPVGRSCATSASGAVPPAPTFSPVHFRRTKRDSLPPLFLGAALSLTPCTPLASLLALAANAGSAAQGASYGLAFGLGAAMTPILVLVPLAGRLGRELRSGREWIARWLTWAAAAVLILLGLRRLWPMFIA